VAHQKYSGRQGVSLVGEIERKSQELQRSGEVKAAQLKAEIEADVAKLKTSLDQFSSKVKSRRPT